MTEHEPGPSATGAAAIVDGGHPGRAPRPRHRLVAILLAALLAFAFQGTRGLWEPDEGHYVNPAVAMLDTGDWLLPRLSSELFLDKPPLVYWSIASGLAVVGFDEWGARCGHALAFLLTALVVGRIGRDLWDRRTGIAAILVYATTLLPFLAANFLTPDTLLAAATTLAWWCALRVQRAERLAARLAWGLALGAALGLGALAKGPAMLVFAAPATVFLLLHARPVRTLVPAALIALVVLLALGLPWYLWVARKVPGAAAYFLDNQALGRLVGEKYQRNSGWVGLLRVYVPTLVVGLLPWTPLLIARAARGRPRSLRACARALWREPVTAALALWIGLPLVVLCLASSRLPLYLLPLAAPLSLVAARLLTAPGGLAVAGGGGRWRWALAAWIVALLALKAALPGIPYWNDSRRLAGALRGAGLPASILVVEVDMKANGLALYGYRRLEQATNGRAPYPFFRPAQHLDVQIRELAAGGEPRAFVVGNKNLGALLKSLAAARQSYSLRDLAGLPYFLVRAPAGAALEP
jgi:4-amino-4-deoxy-L-arabinose transferase-like glycosyltransferase